MGTFLYKLKFDRFNSCSYTINHSKAKHNAKQHNAMATLTPVSLSDPTYDAISDVLYKTYPNACILWIEKVDNPKLEAAYQARKLDIQQKRGKGVVTEKTLYHGTAEANVKNIIDNGFDPECNVVSAYGIGTYFATQALLSSRYAKPLADEVSFMICASVLVGKCAMGTNKGVIDISRFDNSVNSLSDPTIIVTPYKDGCVPRYVIAFHRSAR